jgi:methyltransferase (TIGR00027 family)
MAGNQMETRALEGTARWTAAARAAESQREDRLFSDPWAAALAGPEGMAWIEQRSPDKVLPIVLRTRYFDDWLEGILGGAVRQVVLPAAGLDTRAFRIRWPEGARCFEIDRPSVLGYKAAVLESAGAEPRCDRRSVAADLAEPWADALVGAGFDATLPAAWLLEGFLFYVPADDIARILMEVTRLAAPGSRLGFDIINGTVLASPWTQPWVEMQAAAGAPWIGTMDDPVAFLAERGWRATLTQAGQSEANHGRWTLPVIPTTMPEMPHSWYVTAERVA